MSNENSYYFDRAGLLLAKQARRQEIGDAAYEAALLAKAHLDLAEGQIVTADSATQASEDAAAKPALPPNAAHRLAAHLEASAQFAGLDAAARVRNLGNITTMIAAQDPTIARINAMLYGTPMPSEPQAQESTTTEKDITAEAEKIPHDSP